MSDTTGIPETFPIELVSAIIKTLAGPILERTNRPGENTYDDALNALKACSLACHNFRPLCQQYIFDSIDLETHDRTNGSTPQSIIGRFSETVKTSPIIGTYVKKLVMWFTPYPSHDFEDYYHPNTVASDLRCLTNLKIILLWTGNFNDPINWNNIPSSLTSEIYHLFQLPTMTTIWLFRMQNFNIRSLGPCVGLLHLTLQNSSLDEPKIVSTTVSTKPLQPIFLKIAGSRNGPTLLPKIMASKLFDFRRLETFLLTIACTDEVQQASDFLQQIQSPSLKTIDFIFPVHLNIVEVSALARHSAMKVIETLALYFICPANGINRYLFAMCLFLQNLSNKNRIQLLKIVVEYLPSTWDYENDQDWDVVNNILLGPGWSSLTRVELRIVSLATHESLPQAMTRAAILKKLPQTRLKGLSSTKSFEFFWDLKSSVQDPRGFQYTADL